MKVEITGVWEWTNDDFVQSSIFSHCSMSEGYGMLAYEEREKREELTWWNSHIGKGKTIVHEFDDEDEIVEWFNDNYCNGDMLVAEELDYEIIEAEEEEVD